MIFQIQQMIGIALILYNTKLVIIIFYIIAMPTQLLFDSIRTADNKLAKTLSQNILTTIDTVHDSEKCTVLHLAANYENQEMLQYYLNVYDKLATENPQQYSEQRKNKWFKSKDNEGFSCLHYSVFRANFKIAVLLQDHGADIYQINNQGLNVLHIAAQGDSPLLMYYYLNKGLKIGGTDSKGSTPLHWACYSGQQNSAYALMSWGAQLDRQQFTYGMTPLHLAVMSGNGRIVRKLLIKGCDRNIKSYNGKLPLDIAKENEYKNIAEMIIDKQGIQQLMNIKTPFRKLKRYTFPFYLLLFLFLSNYILNVSFIISTHFNEQTQLAIAFLSLGFIVAVLFLIGSLSNPGNLRNQKTSNYFEMLQKNKQSKICFDCKIVKPQRSRHCQICNSCISVYDHHCPWIANCVGANNYYIFFLFLVSMLIFMLYTIAFEIINFTLTEWDSLQGIQVIRVICEIYSLIVSVLFIVPLVFLMIVQTKNCFQNKTTFERFSAQKLFAHRITDSISDRTSHTTRNQQSSGTHKLSESASFSIEVVHSKSSNYSPLLPQQQESNCGNCYKMWFGNSRNISYQLGH